MDGVTMYDRQPYTSHTSYYTPRGHLEVRSPALSMPRFHEARDAYDDARRHSSMNSSSTSPTWDSPHPAQRHQPSSTHSASYQHGDSNRPSLPSLRTILGENARSPPVTPRHHETPLQPYPREPVYDQSTYKPPSLYPNKRTRTDSGWDGQDAERKPTETTLPIMNGRQEDRSQPSLQLELPILGGASPDTYRHRHPEAHMDSRARSHALMSQHPSPESRGRSIHSQASPRLAPPHTYEVQGRNHAHYHAVPRSESLRDMHSNNGYESALSRSSSISLTEDSARRASGYGHPGVSHQAFQGDVRRHSMLPSAHSTGYPEEYATLTRPESHSGYSAPSYAYPQAFFVPSHYEYQNGKSRKRSNLPKQSTEIMKRWFDDNLQNPYPSEEQKRHFAAVAGINLTQVSNWFINHRRRCPELREKRDKGRAGSRDESV